VVELRLEPHKQTHSRRKPQALNLRLSLKTHSLESYLKISGAAALEHED